MSIIKLRNDYGYISYYSNDQYIIMDTIEHKKFYDQDIVLNVLAPFIKNSVNILDIGGHVGSHSIVYSKLNPNSTIFIFEPQQKLFELLKKNIMENNCNNIKPYNMALGNFNGNFTLQVSATDGSNVNTPVEYGTDKLYNIGGIGFGENGEEVLVSTGDSLDINYVHFIKIDVEGAENLVINGLLNYLSENSPIIIMEFYHNSKNNDSHVAAENQLFSLGYNNYYISTDGRLEIINSPSSQYLAKYHIESDNIVYLKN